MIGASHLDTIFSLPMKRNQHTHIWFIQRSPLGVYPSCCGTLHFSFPKLGEISSKLNDEMDKNLRFKNLRSDPVSTM